MMFNLILIKEVKRYEILIDRNVHVSNHRITHRYS